MINGSVTNDGVPIVVLAVGGKTWSAIVDTGFNGELELPEALRASVNAEFLARSHSHLAAGVSIEEDVFLVEFPFDGEVVIAEAAFTPTGSILVGTRLLRNYRLEVDFMNQTVHLERTA